MTRLGKILYLVGQALQIAVILLLSWASGAGAQPSAARLVDSGARAEFTIDSLDDIRISSTFRPHSFQIRNTSTAGQTLMRLRISLTDALMPDLVFDPNGAAGDPVGKDFTIDDSGGATVLAHAFSLPHDDGFDALEVTFNGFVPGVLVTASADVDPTSIRGSASPGPENSGSISGFELIGAHIEVEFDDGSLLAGEPFRIGTSEVASRVVLQVQALSAPTLSFPGLATPAMSVIQPNHTLRVGGPPGGQVRVLDVETALFLDGVPDGGFDIDAFESNTVIAITEIQAAVGADGSVDIPVSLTQSHPNGGIHVFVAAFETDGIAGDTSDRVLLAYVPGTTTTTAFPTTTTTLAPCATAPDLCEDTNACTDDVCDPAAGCLNLPNARACDDGVGCTVDDICSGNRCVGADNCGVGATCDRSTQACRSFVGRGPEPARRCAALKIRTAGAASSRALRCGLLAGLAAGPCAAAAGAQLRAAFARAESKGGCWTVGDAGSVQAEVNASMTVFHIVLPRNGGSAQFDCSKLRGRATASLVKNLHKCHAAALRNNGNSGAACAQTATDRFTRRMAVNRPQTDCTTTGSPNALKDRALELAARVLAALAGACGDGVTGPAEQCDAGSGAQTPDDRACPGACNNTCTCAPVPCSTGADCDDGNPCTDTTCLPSGICASSFNDTICDDGNRCTLGDRCSGGSCASGAPTDAACDDANPCTNDSCNIASGCTYAPNRAPCDDGYACTDGDTCAGGRCLGEDSCPPGGQCDTASGQCPLVPDFTLRELASLAHTPTVLAWGPDRRLYVGTLEGVIYAYTFDDSWAVADAQQFDAIAGSNADAILGLAFDPRDTGTEPRLYLAHSRLFAQGGDCFSGEAPYAGNVSRLDGPDFATAVPVITGLPVSNHDHGVNALAFDDAGDLLLTVGGNTNAGVADCLMGGLPESPLSGAMLKAETSRSEFNGALAYAQRSDATPSLDQVDAADVDLLAGTHVEVFAPGFRNSFDFTLATNGRIYATDNGPDPAFGRISTSATTQGAKGDDIDELNIVESGNYYGAANRNRGRDDDRQNVYHATGEPGSAEFTQAVATFTSSSNGIDEYRSAVFGGAMRGDLIVQRYRFETVRVHLNEDGSTVVGVETLPVALGSLALRSGPGGVLIGGDTTAKRLVIAEPDTQTADGPAVFDVFPWRMAADGAARFTVAGSGFGTSDDTFVEFGGVRAALTSVRPGRIEGLVPARSPAPAGLLDVFVTVAGVKRRLRAAFRYLP